MRRVFCLLALIVSTGSAAFGQAVAPSATSESLGRTFFVRQASGDDHSDGTSPEAAWRSIGRLSGALEAGDTAYVGPGLYRDQVVLRHGGAPDRRIRLLADAAGVYTHDRPGVVMLTGAEPVDERVFEPYGSPGVYKAPFSDFVPVGVVEMDGPQLRYMRARSTREHLVDGLSELEVVTRSPATYFPDVEARVLYLHTSDDAAPTHHELELIRRGAGITVAHQDFVTISGFTIRHTGDAGILFSNGARHGIAIDNVSYGHRIGIRVNGATEVVVSGNVLFRNENSGVYFLRDSIGGLALDNVLYENVKGVRFGSRSNQGRAIGNLAFRNREAGISVEDSVGIQVMNNRMVRNGEAQLLLWKSRQHQSEGNCFEIGRGSASLAEHQQGTHLDLSSREGDCGALPDKIDVRKLHANSLSYLEQARRKLGPARP